MEWPFLCPAQLRHLDVVIVDDHGVALNTIHFDFKQKNNDSINEEEL